MIDISTELDALANAVYGEEVRGSIANAISKINTQLETSFNYFRGMKVGEVTMQATRGEDVFEIIPGAGIVASANAENRSVNIGASIGGSGFVATCDDGPTVYERSATIVGEPNEAIFGLHNGIMVTVIFENELDLPDYIYQDSTSGNWLERVLTLNVNQSGARQIVPTDCLRVGYNTNRGYIPSGAHAFVFFNSKWYMVTPPVSRPAIKRWAFDPYSINESGFNYYYTYSGENDTVKEIELPNLQFNEYFDLACDGAIIAVEFNFGSNNLTRFKFINMDDTSKYFNINIKAYNANSTTEVVRAHGVMLFMRTSFATWQYLGHN